MERSTLHSSCKGETKLLMQITGQIVSRSVIDAGYPVTGCRSSSSLLFTSTGEEEMKGVPFVGNNEGGNTSLLKWTLFSNSLGLGLQLVDFRLPGPCC